LGVFRFTRTELGKHLIISYSIQEEIQKLKTTESKAYYYLYADSGFELGFGKSGKYSGHSHKFFYDILFSQNQISTRDADGKAILGNLILVPPRTFLGEVQTSDFFFLKFSFTRILIIFFMSATGRGLAKGKRIVPLEVW